jgi:2-oxoisovalerate dehydrogenase E1 component
MEECFKYLDAQKGGSLDTPIPFTKALEDQYLPKADRFETDLLALLAF